MTDREVREDPGEEAQFRRLLVEGLPRYPAPAQLRTAILAAGAPPRQWPWLAPALSALAAALILILVALPFLPRPVPPDPLQPIVRAVLSEHTRILSWGEARPGVVHAALPRLMEETGIHLPWLFGGDEDLALINVAPLMVDRRPALALTYANRDGHVVTYLIFRDPDLPLPAQGRVKIDSFRPLLTRTNGFSLLIWKQQDLACFLISDMVSEAELARFKELFLKIRTAADLW